jgi:predicted CoA-binding protein
MTDDACPLPTTPSRDEEEMIRRMLSAQRIAIVGLSDDRSRPSYQIGEYLIGQGKTVLPVNPNHATVRGLKCFASLADVPGPIDLVNVFRRPQFCADVTREAIAAGAKGMWLQSGITNDESARLSRHAGIDFVQDRCILVEHMRRRGAVGR